MLRLALNESNSYTSTKIGASAPIFVAYFPYFPSLYPTFVLDMLEYVIYQVERVTAQSFYLHMGFS
jgi:hypothetical protein